MIQAELEGQFARLLANWSHMADEEQQKAVAGLRAEIGERYGDVTAERFKLIVDRVLELCAHWPRVRDFRLAAGDVAERLRDEVGRRDRKACDRCGSTGWVRIYFESAVTSDRYSGVMPCETCNREHPIASNPAHRSGDLRLITEEQFRVGKPAYQPSLAPTRYRSHGKATPSPDDEAGRSRLPTAASNEPISLPSEGFQSKADASDWM